MKNQNLFMVYPVINAFTNESMHTLIKIEIFYNRIKSMMTRTVKHAQLLS